MCSLSAIIGTLDEGAVDQLELVVDLYSIHIGRLGAFGSGKYLVLQATRCFDDTFVSLVRFKESLSIYKVGDSHFLKPECVLLLNNLLILDKCNLHLLFIHQGLVVTRQVQSSLSVEVSVNLNALAEHVVSQQVTVGIAEFLGDVFRFRKIGYICDICKPFGKILGSKLCLPDGILILLYVVIELFKGVIPHLILSH